MIIQIICSEKEFIKYIKPMMKENKTDINVLDSKNNNKSCIRINFIKDIILNMKENEIKSELLYRRVRKKGYKYSRRTLKRDLDCLIEDEIIKREVIMGGSVGTHSIIKKVKT